MPFKWNPITNQFDYYGVSEDRVDAIEGTTFKILYYEEISGSETSGTISPPQGSTILLNQWENGVDAVVSNIVGGVPDFEETGIDVDTFDTLGNYTLSGVMATNPAALIYYILIDLVDFNNLNPDRILDKSRLFKYPANVILAAQYGGDYKNLEDALASITDNSETNRYTIQVAPDVQSVNNPLQGKPYVTIEAMGLHTVRLVAQNPNEDLFLGAHLFYLIGFSFVGVTGAGKYAINHSTPGEMVVKDCVYTDCINGVLVNHANALMNLLDNALYTISETMNRGIDVKAGNVTINFLKVVAESTIDTIVAVDGAGSILTPNKILSSSPNVNKGLHFTNGCRVSGVAIGKLVGMVDGMVISGNNTNVIFTSLLIFNAQNNGFRIDNVGTGIKLELEAAVVIDSVGLNFNVLNPNCTISGNGRSQTDNAYIHPDANFHAYILNVDKIGDEALKLYIELHGGTPDRPREMCMGEGDSHTNMKVYSWNGSVFADLTAVAASPTESTFTFPNNLAGTFIIIYNLYEKDGLALRFPGIKSIIETALIPGPGSIVAEYYNGSAWTAFNVMETESFGDFDSVANELFEAVNNFQTFFNNEISKDTSNWAANDIAGYGEDKRCVRFRIVAPVTQLPIFQQFKVRSNSIEINEGVAIQKFGNFRQSVKSILDISVEPLTGFIPGSTVVNYGVGISSAGTYNTLANNSRMGFVLKGEIPKGFDTSSPLELRAVFYGSSATAGDVELEISYTKLKAGDKFDGLSATTSVNEIISIGLNEDLDYKTTLFNVDVSDMKEGDLFVISSFRDARPSNLEDTYVSDIIIVERELTGLTWKI